MLSSTLWSSFSCAYPGIETPIENERKKQTYYGALNYQSKEFILKDYETGNSENTVDFMKYLQAEY
jgi:hypothetical protein